MCVAVCVWLCVRACVCVCVMPAYRMGYIPAVSTDVWVCTFCHVADSWLLWYSPHHMTIVLPFKEATVPGLQPQGGLLREQEGP